jgi:isochorismate synthase
VSSVTTVRASRLGPSFDLLAAYEPTGMFFERAGAGLSTGAPAATVTLPAATLPDAALERLFDGFDVLDPQPGAPPAVVVGAIPFDTRGDAVMHVPRRAVRRDPGGPTWDLEVRSPGDPAAPSASSERLLGQPAPNPAFSGVQLRPEPSAEAYAHAVADAVARIRGGELRKVVLARTVVVSAGRMLDARQVLRRLRAVEPDCFAFAIALGSGRMLVGASPEMLVSRRGRTVRANPLAGSAPRFGDPDEDAASAARLSASAKDREEHAIVVDAVASVLGPFCDHLTWDREPVLLATANVWHLSTRFEGTLREPAVHALALACALHPTPAVCGDPTDVAMGMIGALEPVPRGHYAGAVGWMDAAGDGEWAIALRCAELRDDTARLYAGAGIVAASDPDAEVDETERKFRAFLDSLRWG